MKALQLAEPKVFKRIDAPEPAKPGRGEALIRTSRMGICGTDVSCYLGKFPFIKKMHQQPRLKNLLKTKKKPTIKQLLK